MIGLTSCQVGAIGAARMIPGSTIIGTTAPAGTTLGAGMILGGAPTIGDGDIRDIWAGTVLTTAAGHIMDTAAAIMTSTTDMPPVSEDLRVAAV